MTIIAASFYAYLAGVVVDLVAQRGDAAREINGLLDGLLVYLDCIDFPSARTRHFKRFFWLCRPYLLRNYFRELLPELSPKLNGELAKFNYGKVQHPSSTPPAPLQHPSCIYLMPLSSSLTPLP
jgi:hypothetical protein